MRDLGCQLTLNLIREEEGDFVNPTTGKINQYSSFKVPRNTAKSLLEKRTDSKNDLSNFFWYL